MALTKNDRCDKDGAAAETRWKKPGTDGTLEFCGHHTTELAPGLRAQGFHIVDADDEVKARAFAAAGL